VKSGNQPDRKLLHAGWEDEMRNLFVRMIRASRLDAQTYEDVEADPSSLPGAVFIVLAASIAAAIGTGMRNFADIATVTVFSVATWAVWVGLTYFIGTRLLPGRETQTDLGEIFRTTGYSASPGVLRILGMLPSVGVPIFIGVTFWMLLAFVIAIRQALDYSGSGRAFAVCILGWLIHGILFFAFVMTAI
jgi:hypothetical protein